MNYDWLLSFVVFADHLNFTHAAKALHITQPALHAQIRKLSEEVGVTLYRRDGRALALTPEGRRLAAYGREVREEGLNVLADLRGEASRGPVVLAAGQGAFLYLLGAAIKRFPKRRWPLRALALTGPQTVDAVRDARADVGVAVVHAEPDGLHCEHIRDVGQLVLVPKGHRLCRRRKVTPRDLDGENIVVAPEGSPHRSMLTQALATAGTRWSVAVEATGWELMIQFARYGLGIAVVNDFCPVPRGFSGILLEGVPAVTFSVITRPSSRSEGRDALVKLIVETARDG